jgi:hypothetical protein
VELASCPRDALLGLRTFLASRQDAGEIARFAGRAAAEAALERAIRAHTHVAPELNAALVDRLVAARVRPAKRLPARWRPV